MSIQRKWDHLTKDQRHAAIQEIISHFQEEREEEVGMFEAEDLLDFFQELIGKAAYNKGIEAARNAMRQGFESLEVDLEVLMEK